MKRRVNQLFVPFLILCTLGLSQTQAQQVQFFTNSLSQLENQVKQSRTPYFLYFNVLDCEACTKMQREAFSYSPLANYVANSYLAMQVDGLDFSEGIDIATRYNVKKYPTTMIFGPDGQVRERVEGYIDGPMMLTLLQKAVRPSDRDLANRNLNTYSPPSSAGADRRVTGNSRGDYDARYGDRGLANSNPFDDRPDPSFNSQPSLVNSNNTETTRSENYDFGVDKRDYLEKYFDNRSTQPMAAKGVNTTRGGTPTTYGSQDQLNQSFYDDRTRSAYNNATSQGNYVYQKPVEKPFATLEDKYPNESYLDDRSRDPNYRPTQNYGYGQTRGGDSQVGNTASNPPSNYPDNSSGGSFLDPVEGYGTDRSGQRTQASYAGQAVTNLDDLPDGTVLKRGPDGRWYIYDEYRGNNMDPEQPTRGGNETAMRVGNTAPSAAILNNTPKTITRSVPGFAEYSPKDLTQNTFGLVIGSYVSMSELQDAMKEFMEHNTAKLWVYSEKLGGTHFFKLVMGEYNGEQQAVSDALRMGATWEDIEVVNLARLR